MIELEAKVRLDDAIEVQGKLDEFADFIWKKTKIDTYFSKSKGEYPEFRTRELDWTIIFTKKNSQISNWIETNEEIEFTVDGQSEFISFVKWLGFIVSDKKIKESLVYKKWDFNIDLCNIEWLWWFLEIEILSLEDNLEQDRIKLNDIFQSLGFREDDYEKKRYLDLLNDY